MKNGLIVQIYPSHNTSNYGNIPQSIRALRAAPGFSKLIAYRMTPPRSFANLHERVGERSAQLRYFE